MGTTRTLVKVTLRDLDGAPIAHGGHALELARVSGPVDASAGRVLDHGDGSYSFRILGGKLPGTSTWSVRVRDGIRPVTLYPFMQVEIVP